MKNSMVRVRYDGRATGPRRYHVKGARSFYWFGPGRHAEQSVHTVDLDWLLGRREFGQLVFSAVDESAEDGQGPTGVGQDPTETSQSPTDPGQDPAEDGQGDNKPAPRRTSRRKKKPESEASE